MNIIQSYWSKPYDKSSIGNQMGGWCNKTFHYMSCALSCLKLSEFYPVELISDKKGIDILVDKIGLPYRSVKDDLEFIDYPTELWAIAKIIAYGLQTEPFLHIDNDVYIWSEFPEHITKSNLAVQSIEKSYTYNKLYIEEVISKFNYVSNVIIEQNKINPNTDSINAGIIGGNNLSFIKEYSREAIKLLELNIDNLDRINNTVGFNLVFEQCLFHSMAKQKNEIITCLLNKNMDFKYKELVQFWTIPNYNTYIHTIASYKKHYIIGEQVTQRLWYEYPEFFFRIQNLIKKNVI